MHVAQIPIIRKQLVSSRLQHAGKKPNIPDTHLSRDCNWQSTNDPCLPLIMPVSILMKLCDGAAVHMAGGIPGHA